mmetsp:Transcript_39994/g.128258  ORF Transcript_39994/g.128258 Transcript_39994/m.128258 type:complete len:249 (+) Transcript_39994:1691-2437(+)
MLSTCTKEAAGEEVWDATVLSVITTSATRELPDLLLTATDRGERGSPSMATLSLRTTGLPAEVTLDASRAGGESQPTAVVLDTGLPSASGAAMIESSWLPIAIGWTMVGCMRGPRRATCTALPAAASFGARAAVAARAGAVLAAGSIGGARAAPGTAGTTRLTRRSARGEPTTPGRARNTGSGAPDRIGRGHTPEAASARAGEAPGLVVGATCARTPAAGASARGPARKTGALALVLWGGSTFFTAPA